MTALVALVAPAASAEPTEAQVAEARRLYGVAADAFAAERYADALDAYRSSYELNPVAIVQYNIGMVQRALFDFPASIASFRRYLRDAEPDSVPAERRTEIAGLLREMEATVAALTVAVTQPGAVVLVDGSERGVSPLSEPILLRAGSHLVEARREGFEEARETVQLSEGQALQVTLVLDAIERAPTVLRVTSNTPGASVSIDGVFAGVVPFETEVVPGDHLVTVRADGFEPAEVPTVVDEGQIRDLVVPLAPVVVIPEPDTRVVVIEGQGAEPGPGVEEEDEDSLWWVWTLVGVAVAGGAVAAGVLLWPEEADRPGADAELWLR